MLEVDCLRWSWTKRDVRDGMFAVWLCGKNDTTGFGGRFVVPPGRVNKLVPVMRIACACSSSTGCDFGGSTW